MVLVQHRLIARRAFLETLPYSMPSTHIDIGLGEFSEIKTVKINRVVKLIAFMLVDN